MPSNDTIPVVFLDEVDSTNAHARRWLVADADTAGPRWFVAKVQTAGRGRDGREWSSPAGGLWATLAWPLELSPSRVEIGLGLRLGVALTETIASAGTGDRARLKWPNDVLVEGRKIAGILTEIVSIHAKRWAIVGCGINVANAPKDLPEPLRESATSLNEWLAIPMSPADLLDDLSVRVRAALQVDGLDAATLSRARQLLFGIGERCRVRRAGQPDVVATLVGLNDGGRAVYRGDNGLEFVAEPIVGA